MKGHGSTKLSTVSPQFTKPNPAHVRAYSGDIDSGALGPPAPTSNQNSYYASTSIKRKVELARSKASQLGVNSFSHQYIDGISAVKPKSLKITHPHTISDNPKELEHDFVHTLHVSQHMKKSGEGTQQPQRLPPSRSSTPVGGTRKRLDFQQLFLNQRANKASLQNLPKYSRSAGSVHSPSIPHQQRVNTSDGTSMGRSATSPPATRPSTVPYKTKITSAVEEKVKELSEKYQTESAQSWLLKLMEEKNSSNVSSIGGTESIGDSNTNTHTHDDATTTNTDDPFPSPSHSKRGDKQVHSGDEGVRSLYSSAFDGRTERYLSTTSPLLPDKYATVRKGRALTKQEEARQQKAFYKLITDKRKHRAVFKKLRKQLRAEDKHQKRIPREELADEFGVSVKCSRVQPMVNNEDARTVIYAPHFVSQCSYDDVELPRQVEVKQNEAALAQYVEETSVKLKQAAEHFKDAELLTIDNRPHATRMMVAGANEHKMHVFEDDLDSEDSSDQSVGAPPVVGFVHSPLLPHFSEICTPQDLPVVQDMIQRIRINRAQHRARRSAMREDAAKKRQKKAVHNVVQAAAAEAEQQAEKEAQSSWPWKRPVSASTQIPKNKALIGTVQIAASPLSTSNALNQSGFNIENPIVQKNIEAKRGDIGLRKQEAAHLTLYNSSSDDSTDDDDDTTTTDEDDGGVLSGSRTVDDVQCVGDTSPLSSGTTNGKQQALKQTRVGHTTTPTTAHTHLSEGSTTTPIKRLVDKQTSTSNLTGSKRGGGGSSGEQHQQEEGAKHVGGGGGGGGTGLPFLSDHQYDSSRWHHKDKDVSKALQLQKHENGESAIPFHFVTDTDNTNNDNQILDGSANCMSPFSKSRHTAAGGGGAQVDWPTTVKGHLIKQRIDANKDPWADIGAAYIRSRMHEHNRPSTVSSCVSPKRKKFGRSLQIISGSPRSSDMGELVNSPQSLRRPHTQQGLYSSDIVASTLSDEFNVQGWVQDITIKKTQQTQHRPRIRQKRVSDPLAVLGLDATNHAGLLDPDGHLELTGDETTQQAEYQNCMKVIRSNY